MERVGLAERKKLIARLIKHGPRQRAAGRVIDRAGVVPVVLIYLLAVVQTPDYFFSLALGVRLARRITTRDRARLID